MARVRNLKDYLEKKNKNLNLVDKVNIENTTYTKESISRYNKKKLIKQNQIEKIKEQGNAIDGNTLQKTIHSGMESVDVNATEVSKIADIKKHEYGDEKNIPNPLHKFATYTYLFTLSGISESEIRDPRKIKNNPPHDIIARSGGIGQGGTFSSETLPSATDGLSPGEVNARYSADTQETMKKRQQAIREGIDRARTIFEKNHDIYFERVEIDGVHAPNPQRKSMNFTKIEMELSEPLGVTFYEKLRASSGNCGFIDHLDAPYLLTLEFVGMDSKGKVHRNVVPKKYYPIKLVNSELDISAGGSRYTVTAVPYTEFAMVNRYLYIRGPATVKGGTIKEQFNSLLKSIANIQKHEIENGAREYADEYRITIDPYYDGQKQEDVGKPMTHWNIGNFNIVNVGFGEDAVDPGLAKEVGMPESTQFNASTSIANIMESIMLRTNAYKNLADKFITKYWNKQKGDKLEEEYVPWFKIITSIQTDVKKMDNKTKMHPKIIHYHVQPYLIHIGNFVVPGLGDNAQWGKNVKKNYDYIFTGQNLDVLDLNINYKVAFFQSRLYGANDASHDKKNISKDKASTKDSWASTGSQHYPDASNPFRAYPGATGGSEDPSAKDETETSNTRQWFDYLTNPEADMIKVELEIMGDPAWLGHDAALPMEYINDYDPLNPVVDMEKIGQTKGASWHIQEGAFNYDTAEPIYTLDFKMPTDFDEKSGFHNFSKAEQNVQFSGLYKCYRVTSTFNEGQFRQTLYSVRIKNQQKFSKVASTKDNKAEAIASKVDKESMKTDSKGVVAPNILIDFNDGEGPR